MSEFERFRIKDFGKGIKAVIGIEKGAPLKENPATITIPKAKLRELFNKMRFIKEHALLEPKYFFSDGEIGWFAGLRDAFYILLEPDSDVTYEIMRKIERIYQDLVNKYGKEGIFD